MDTFCRTILFTLLFCLATLPGFYSQEAKKTDINTPLGYWKYKPSSDISRNHHYQNHQSSERRLVQNQNIRTFYKLRKKTRYKHKREITFMVSINTTDLDESTESSGMPPDWWDSDKGIPATHYIPGGSISHFRSIMPTPPRITTHPPNEVAYKSEEQQELQCVASGDPPPSYEWEKDGKPLIQTPDIKRKAGSGTLIFTNPLSAHEGVYQCFASNEFGKAVSVKTMFKEAKLDSFPTAPGSPPVHKPVVGTEQTLNCRPPYSYPAGSVYWSQSGGEGGSDKVNPIKENERVATDFNGNLHITNVESGDDLGGKRYVCVVQNSKLRGLVQGDDQLIKPRSVTVTPRQREPELMWHSETPTVAIKGDTKKLKCIFAGYPTPKVTWRKIDGELPGQHSIENFGMTLVLNDVDYAHEGQYECKGSAGGREDTKTIVVTVESEPFWVTVPESVNSSEEEDAEFVCEVGGKPKPGVQWMINGKPIEIDPNPRRRVDGNRVSYTNLTKTDAQVLQCNASNSHGYIFSNAYLNVLAEPPSVITPPQSILKVAQGQIANITCRMFGAPTPRISWKQGDMDITDHVRKETQKKGDLVIKDVVTTDAGIYECHAWNKFGEMSASGTLVVRNKTEITNPPQDKTVMAGDDVVFECEAKTDQFEAARLKIIWLMGEDEIDFETNGRMFMDTRTNALHIKNADVYDSEKFTCVATNGLDRDEITVTLTVKDVPDPPFSIVMDACSASKVELKWMPGSDNNDPIIDFTLYFNTSFDAPGKFHEAKVIDAGDENFVKFGLTPWANYTFHLKARNSLGYSAPSVFTTVCKTPPSFPYKNPQGVCTESRNPDQLVIVWKPMGRMDHNGEGFRYVVSYKREDEAEETKEIITNHRQRELVIDNVPTFTKYEVYVLAVNDKGDSKGRLTTYIGHSGEDVPMDSPQNLRVLDDSINATFASLMWEPVDDDPARIRGYFKGYRIVYWRDSKPEDKRETDVILREVNLCPVKQRNRAKRQSDQDGDVMGHVADLWPFSQIIAGVKVLNGGQTGELSDTVSFETPEGVPGMLEFADIIETGSHHFKVKWGAPFEINGILIGYSIMAVPVNGGDPVSAHINHPFRTSGKVTDLEPDTAYRVTVFGRTVKGTGVPYPLEGRTLPSSPPDMPGIAAIIPGDTFLNVSWVPTHKEEDEKNPGSHFYVEYKKPGEDEWTRVDPEQDSNWANISGLDNGEKYEVRVVAVNGDNETNISPVTVVEVGIREESTEPPPEPVVANVASAGWFIALMCLLIFLIIVILILCLVKRNRGQKYHVQEKEKLRGRDPEMDDEPSFDEYTRAEEPAPKKQTSIDSEQKPLGSERDSLDEYYDDPDMAKFNEDGSFIGQYTDAKKENALSTFV